jgi:hypothetical protein
VYLSPKVGHISGLQSIISAFWACSLSHWLSNSAGVR